MSNDENNLFLGDPTDVGSGKLLVFLTLGLGIVGFLLTTDIILDILGLYGRFHIWFEAGSLVGILGLFAYTAKKLWNARRISGQLRGKLAVDEAEIARLNEELRQWQSENEALRTQFSERFEEQCEQWNLSTAEIEVARSLLLGKSLKMIALERGTSQPTVRQQASDIYRKSGLQGRTELSAWFLRHVL